MTRKQKPNFIYECPKCKARVEVITNAAEVSHSCKWNKNKPTKWTLVSPTREGENNDSSN